MKIKIVVYSKSGNTLLVAEKVKNALISKGNKVDLERLEVFNEEQPVNTEIRLKNMPEIASYDAVIFASPVNGFSLAQPMKIYLSKIPDIKDKNVYCFVTQHLKKAWLGGNRAVKEIKSACKKKGGNILMSGIVNWSSEKRKEQISDIVKRFTIQ